jgi:hypothetical protein
MTRRLEDWEEDMRRVVSDKLMQDIVADNRRQAPSAAGPAAKVTIAGAPRVVTGSDAVAHGGSGGWAEARSIENYRAPGIDHIDRLCDAADLLDRAQRIRELVEAATVTRALTEAEREVLAQELKKQKAPTNER